MIRRRKLQIPEARTLHPEHPLFVRPVAGQNNTENGIDVTSGQNSTETVAKLTVEQQLSGLLLQEHLIRRTRNLFGGRA